MMRSSSQLEILRKPNFGDYARENTSRFQKGTMSLKRSFVGWFVRSQRCEDEHETENKYP